VFATRVPHQNGIGLTMDNNKRMEIVKAQNEMKWNDVPNGIGLSLWRKLQRQTNKQTNRPKSMMEIDCCWWPPACLHGKMEAQRRQQKVKAKIPLWLIKCENRRNIFIPFFGNQHTHIHTYTRTMNVSLLGGHNGISLSFEEIVFFTYLKTRNSDFSLFLPYFLSFLKKKNEEKMKRWRKIGISFIHYTNTIEMKEHKHCEDG
jgi:hypothetical protein